MPKILVIDDDNVMCLLLKTAIKSKTDYDYFEATTASEGLILLITEMPDVVVIDVNLHDAVTGLQILTAIRSCPFLSHVHAIIMTGVDFNAVLDDISLCLTYNTSKKSYTKLIPYFIKPFSPFDLVERAKELIEDTPQLVQMS